MKSLCQDTEWNYKENGPDEWPVEYSGCNGRQQSPIDLITSIAKYNDKLKPINFNNYNQNIRWNISNTGNSSIQVKNKFSTLII